jgi:branched-chain amino acid transport system ATP-binding protein
VSPVLEVRALETGYGASQVLFGLDLVIRPGEVATLLGRNGMGKSTTLRAVLGLLRVWGGSIALCGKRIDGVATDAIARAGVALVPEGRQVFPNLTVAEHLIAFAANRSATQEPWTARRIYEFFPQLRSRARHLGSELSGGEQQMLSIARALMTNPRLLILDEATEGLAPLVRAEIWQCLAALKHSGQTLLVIDKYVQALIALADHHTIIERGRVAWHGTSRELDADHSLWQRYLGIG